MAKSKRSSKRSSKKNKNKACRKRGHGAVFCDLAEAGRVLTTISVVLNFVICAIVLIVSIVLVVKGKDGETIKLGDNEPSVTAKEVGEGGIVFSLIWAAWVGLVWWLVEKYDIISVISISFWLLSLVVGIIAGVNFHKKVNGGNGNGN
jgi:hypothetical protein